jgi:hypothetical protein
MASKENIDAMIRTRLNAIAAAEDATVIMEETGNLIYELCAGLLNEEKPGLRAKRHEAIVVQLRAMSRFFAIDAHQTHGVPMNLVEQQLSAADAMGSKMTKKPLADEQDGKMSVLHTPVTTGLVNAHGKQLRITKD